MNIAEVKKELGMESLPLTRAVDPVTKGKLPFLIYWDDKQRRRIIMHEDTLKVANTAGSLMMNSKVLESKDDDGKLTGRKYTQIAIFVAAEVEIVL